MKDNKADDVTNDGGQVAVGRGARAIGKGRSVTSVSRAGARYGSISNRGGQIAIGDGAQAIGGDDR